FVVTDPAARQASKEFLQRVRGRHSRLRDVFSHLYCFAATLLDRVYMAAGEFDRFELEIEGLALLEQAQEAGRGCVLLGSHLGSFDLLMLARRAFGGRPVNVVMRVDPRARVRRIAGVDDSTTRVIELGHPDSYLRAHEALVRGEVVALLADRIEPGAPSLEVDFLGRPALLPLAPHVLAARAQAPVLMCFGVYEGG